MKPSPQHLPTLQKYLAWAGVGSRRACEELIRAGRVAIEGTTASLGDRVGPASRVLLDGRPVEPINEKYYVLLNKPVGYTVTKRDPHARKTVMELVAGLPYASLLNPVGRLDKHTSGLLLLTNDGDLANCLTHPSFEVEKTYQVTTDRVPTEDQLMVLTKGVVVGERISSAARVRVAKRAKKHTVVEITLHEGRKRQVRLMFAAVGLPVLALRRIAFGPLRLEHLDLGRYRLLDEEEVAALRRAVSR